MMKRILIILIVIIAIASQALAAGEGKPFRLGIIDIGDSSEEVMAIYQPLAQFLASNLKEYGFKAGQIVATNNVPDMVKKIRKNEVDLLFVAPLSLYELQKEIPLVPSVCLWRKGVKVYQTDFFVRKESPVQSLAGLKGKTIVFEVPGSSSGFAIPMAVLAKNGIVVAAEKSGTVVAAGGRYLFAGAALNQVYWVIEKRGDAGAINNSDWEEVPEKIRDDLRIIYSTKPILRFVGIFHPALSPAIKAAAERVLVTMATAEEGRNALQRAHNIKKIEMIGEAERSSLDYADNLLRFYQ